MLISEVTRPFVFFPPLRVFVLLYLWALVLKEKTWQKWSQLETEVSIYFTPTTIRITVCLSFTGTPLIYFYFPGVVFESLPLPSIVLQFENELCCHPIILLILLHVSCQEYSQNLYFKDLFKYIYFMNDFQQSHSAIVISSMQMFPIRDFIVLLHFTFSLTCLPFVLFHGTQSARLLNEMSLPISSAISQL